VRHAVLEDEIGKIREAQQMRLGPPQFQNADQTGAVVMQPGGRA
jgi:hypothetical protein